MKTLILLLLLVTASHSEELHFSKKQSASLQKFNSLYDSLYALKSFHGKDSTAKVQQMNSAHKLFNK